MLTEKQRRLITQKVMNDSRIPSYLKRELGMASFPTLINEIDTLLHQAIPESSHKLIHDSSNGLTLEEISDLSNDLLIHCIERVKYTVLKSAIPIALPVIVNEILIALGQGKTITP